MKIVFTGSRHWTNYGQIKDNLSALQDVYGDNLEIAHGQSTGGGADLMVEQAVLELNIAQTPFPVQGGADAVDGPFPAAPLRRNRRMLTTFLPDLVIAFRAAGRSNGTDNTISTARRLGVEVETIDEDKD